jgi:hypothetical protein
MDSGTPPPRECEYERNEDAFSSLQLNEECVDSNVCTLVVLMPSLARKSLEIDDAHGIR